MSLLVPSVLAWLAIGQLPLPAPLPTPAQDETGLRSDTLEIDESTGVWHPKGHVVLKTPTIEVRAEEMSYYPDEQRVKARGNAVMFQESLVGFADEMDVLLATGEATLVGGTMLQKRNVSSQALLQATSRQQLEQLGQTTMSVKGRHVQRIAADHFLVDGIEFTPCDCNPVKPSWSIHSLKADIIPGERALLTLPVIYVRGVPILAFPWLYVPMADRRSGLLIPRWGNARSSFFLEQPVFVTLGRSYDLTFTPGYYFGGSDLLGVKGPRLQTEVNYATQSVRSPPGRANLDLVYDSNPPVNPLTGAALIDPQTTHRGWRGSGSWRQAQELGGGFYDRIDASVASDGFYPSSLTADIITREVQYANSTAVLYRRTAQSYAGAYVGVRQDLRFGYGFLDTALSPADFPAHGPNPLQRLPELTFDFPEARLYRWLFGSLRIEYNRLAPLRGTVGIDPIALVDPATFPSGWDPAPLPPRDRIDFRPRISVPLELGRFARFTPYAWYRQDFYVFESSGSFPPSPSWQSGQTTYARGYPALGAILETEVSKTFSSGSSRWRHSVAPSIELRSAPTVFGSPSLLYDEIDRAAPSGGFVQGVAQISQKLIHQEGAAIRRFIGLDIGQGFDLKTGAAADTFARLTASAAPLNGTILWRYDLHASRLARFSTNVGLDYAWGLNLSLSYDNLIVAGPDNMRRGIDELVGPAVTNPNLLQRNQQLTLHAGIRFNFGIALGYDVLATPLPDPRCPSDPNADRPSFCPDPSAPPLMPWTIRQQVFVLSINPSCNCWRVDVSALIRRDFIVPEFRGNPAVPLKPDFAVTFTLARFGSFGL
jgi:LPS-assembly protein